MTATWADSILSFIGITSVYSKCHNQLAILPTNTLFFKHT